MQRLEAGSSVAKANTVPSDGKVKALVYLDAKVTVGRGKGSTILIF